MEKEVMHKSNRIGLISAYTLENYTDERSIKVVKCSIILI